MLKAKAKTRAKTDLLFCGSGLAREKPESAAFIRMPASSLTTFASKPAPTFLTVPALAFDLLFNTQAGREAAVLLLLILILI
ncbi:hypothetical protein P0D91_29320 [Pseudomonas sp. CBSPBW29]|nr:hypothetical protein P0D91_29320 [Pseudomonas sp. CBSPBW29]